MDPPIFTTFRTTPRRQADNGHGTAVQTVFDGEYLDQLVETGWDAEDVAAHNVEQQNLVTSRLPYGPHGVTSPSYAPVMAPVQAPSWGPQANSARMSWEPNSFSGVGSFGYVNAIGTPTPRLVQARGANISIDRSDSLSQGPERDVESGGMGLDFQSPSIERLHELLQFAFRDGLDFSYSHNEQLCRLSRPTARGRLATQQPAARDEATASSINQALVYTHQSHDGQAILSPVLADEPLKSSSASIMTMNTWTSGTTLQAGEEDAEEPASNPPQLPTFEHASPSPLKPTGCSPFERLACSCCKPPKLFEGEKPFLRHQKEKPFPCGWPNCNTRTSTQSDLKRHVNSIHDNEVYWSCRDLNKIDLTRYLSFQSRSDGFNTYEVCGLCSAKFIHAHDGPNRRDMRRHAYEYHFGRPCMDVKEYSRSDSFRKHLRTHHKTEEVNNPVDWETSLLNVCKKVRGPLVGLKT